MMDTYQPLEMGNDYQQMRREHDRISLIEARARAALLGGLPPRGTAPLTLSFAESVRLAVADVTLGLQELLVEVWLRNLPPWAEGGDETALGCVASTTIFATAEIAAARIVPDDILLATVTAGRPLRFDDAMDHPLVRAWAANGGIDPDMVVAFMSIPLFRGGQSLGVLAVALPQVPTPEHATFLDALGHFIATGAEVARLGHQLHAQRALAQTVLREAPLAAAVLRAADNVIIFTNPRFDDLLGIGPDVWGQELDVVLPDHAGQLRTTFKLDEVRQSGATQLLIDLP
ncbi:MAG: GAF domain-containing protein, partial [Ktedonobacterales bacterium]|nr:GAF domain-containing protein [Ktedonobacterales bacterium]